MTNQITLFFKRNKEGMIIGSIIGAIAYFIWKGFVPKQMSILSETLSQTNGLIDKIGGNLDLKLFLFFVVVGFSIGMFIDMIYKPKG